jgi:hypothetical protein
MSSGGYRSPAVLFFTASVVDTGRVVDVHRLESPRLFDRIPVCGELVEITPTIVGRVCAVVWMTQQVVLDFGTIEVTELELRSENFATNLSRATLPHV